MPYYVVFCCKPSPKLSLMVHLRKKLLKSGNISLFLDYSINGKRVKEYLNITYHPKDKQSKDIVRKAEIIRAERQMSLLYDKTSMVNPSRSNIYVNDFWEDYNKGTERKDYRVFKAALNGWTELFGRIRFANVNHDVINQWIKHLEQTKNGETPNNYWKATKRIFKEAVKQKYINSNPTTEYTIRSSDKKRIKNVLWPDELKKIMDTKCPNEQVKSAFLFSAVTAIRPVDIFTLTWDQVKTSPVGTYVELKQSKTGFINIVWLNDTAIKYLGEKKKGKIFDLPTMNGCNKAIRSWVANAGINKHITFYCARHSAITNILHATGGNVKIAQTLAGHRTTRYTERYMHILNKTIKDAVDKINIG